MATIPNMVLLAAGTLGFGCGLQPDGESDESFHSTKMSIWHDTQKLKTFSLKDYDTWHSRKDTVKFSTGVTFSDWLGHVGVQLPTPVVPVCYGGNFAVKVSNILSVTKTIDMIRNSLTRGDNIIEGHYAERTWAGLLMARIPAHTNDLIQRKMEFVREQDGYVGAIYGCVS